MFYLITYFNLWKYLELWRVLEGICIIFSQGTIKMLSILINYFSFNKRRHINFITKNDFTANTKSFPPTNSPTHSQETIIYFLISIDYLFLQGTFNSRSAFREIFFKTKFTYLLSLLAAGKFQYKSMSYKMQNLNIKTV